jgi:hypothetical protein
VTLISTLSFIAVIGALGVTMWAELARDVFAHQPVVFMVLVITLWVAMVASAHTWERSQVKPAGAAVPMLVPMLVQMPCEPCCTCAVLEQPGTSYDIAPRRESPRVRK